MGQNGWFYLYGGKQQGPIDEDSLAAKISKGELARDVHVWRDGASEEWIPAEAVPELAHRIPPPVPAAQQEPKWYKATLTSPNRPATLALWLAFVSIFFYWIGIIPLIALGTSVYALVKARKMNGAGRNRALIALVISTVYILMYLGHHGHLGGSK